MDKWEGKVAVVTGASSGIGKAIVIELAKCGIIAVGLARRSGVIEDYATQLGEVKGKIYAYNCDVSNLESLKSTFKSIEDKFGSISIHINNAAIIMKGDLTSDDEDIEEKINQVINTNFTGAVHCARAAVRLINKSNEHGIIVNINSIAGHSVPNYPGLNIYPSSKFALRSFSESLRLELVQKNNKKIRVTNLSPGNVKTDMAINAIKNVNPQVTDEIINSVAFLKPEEIAQTVKFLLEVPYNVNITEMTVKPLGEVI